MEAHFELSDALFEEQFKAGTLAPALFSHEAHLRLAWIHIKHYGVEKAIENSCSQILAFVEAAGARDKHNKTLTVAAIKVVNHFMNKTEAENFYDFIHQFPQLKYQFKELIASHYQTDIYHSGKAKKEYLEPDLLPFS